MALIQGPKEYQSSNWGKTLSVSDVWEGPYDELISQRDTIKESYTTTHITPTKGGHGRLVASLTNDPETGEPAAPAGDLTIEVEWVELRLPVESNPAFDAISALDKAKIRKAAQNADADSTVPAYAGAAQKLYDLIYKGTTEYSTGVPVIRKTTKNASNIARGTAWIRDEPPVTITGWEWLKTSDRRSKVGNDITQIEEWTGAIEWDADLYPA